MEFSRICVYALPQAACLLASPIELCRANAVAVSRYLDVARLTDRQCCNSWLSISKGSCSWLFLAMGAATGDDALTCASATWQPNDAAPGRRRRETLRRGRPSSRRLPCPRYRETQRLGENAKAVRR